MTFTKGYSAVVINGDDRIALRVMAKHAEGALMAAMESPYADEPELWAAVLLSRTITKELDKL